MIVEPRSYSTTSLYTTPYFKGIKGNKQAVRKRPPAVMNTSRHTERQVPESILLPEKSSSIPPAVKNRMNKKNLRCMLSAK